jgi:hypothetical protein
MVAFAIAITEENIEGVILSEAGPNYDIGVALQWLEEYETGWFVRDPGSPLDCSFFVPEVFAEMYIFMSDDRHSLMRRIVKI